MKLAIMQPYFFPYLGYFQLIHSVDKFIIYDNVGYKKKAWCNRNRILIKKQGPSWITVPIKKVHPNDKISIVGIVEGDSWKKYIKKTISVNYKKAPEFDSVYELINKILNYQTDLLSELNGHSIKSICDYLNIKTTISSDSSKYNFIEENLDNPMYTAENYEDINRKSARILEISKIEKALKYHNPINGQSLYDKQTFKNYGLELKFLNPHLTSYNQFENRFISSLSIIDVLMFNSIEQTTLLLNQYELL